MVKTTININKKNNNFSSQIIEDKKTKTCYVGNPGPSVVKPINGTPNIPLLTI